MPDLSDVLTSFLRGALMGIVGGVMGIGVAVAAPDRPEDRAMRDGIAGLSQMLGDPAYLAQSAPALLQAAGLFDLVTPSAPPGPLLAAPGPVHSREAVEAQPLDLRLALTMLTQISGATDTGAVLTAQGPDSTLRALVIRKGDATLADVARFLSQYHLQDPSADENLTLNVPLVIWEGASLTLTAGQTLEISRPNGAFVVNFGHLAMTGAAVRSEGDENTYLPRFAPFVATTGSGSFHIEDSRFQGLGFGRTHAFGGFSVIRNNLMIVRHRSFIRDSLFERVVSVVISAAADIRIEGNRIQQARGTGLILANSPRARVVSNLFAGASEFNAIQVVEGSVDAVISGNVVLNGAKSGIVVRSSSHRPYVANNLVWNRTGGGITVDKSNCASILANLVMENSQKGIEVRSSDGSLVQDNRVLSNDSAGIWISAQSPGARTFIVQNVLHDNRSGLATATAGNMILSGNDFTGQFPRFLSGDVARQSHYIAQDLDGGTPLLLTAAGGAPVPDAISPCAQN